MKIVGHEKKELLDGHAENRCLATFLCAAPFTESLNHTTQTRKKKTWKHVYTHTHTHTIQHNTTPKKLLVVRPLCVFIVFEDKVIPSHFYVLCTRRQRHTHTHIHGNTRRHTLPRLVFWPLKSFLLSFMLHTYTPFETNTPLFPSCSRLARSPLREPSREPCEQLSSESL